MSNTDAGILLKAIFAYNASGEISALPPVATPMFAMFRAQFDRDAERYSMICDRNKRNGPKGGRPAKTQETHPNPVGYQETQKTQWGPVKPDSDSDSDNDSDNKDTPEDKSSSVSSRKRSHRITFGYDGDYEFHGITEADKRVWQECYPATKLDQELREMRAWLKSNPKKRKIDVERFINSWLKRSQDTAPVYRQDQSEFSNEERDNATALL